MTLTRYSYTIGKKPTKLLQYFDRKYTSTTDTAVEKANGMVTSQLLTAR